MKSYEEFKELACRLRPLTIPYSKRVYGDDTVSKDTVQNLTKENADLCIKEGSVVAHAVLELDKNGLRVHKHFKKINCTASVWTGALSLLCSAKDAGIRGKLINAFIERSSEYKKLAADVELLRSAPLEWWADLEDEDRKQSRTLRGNF
jgi:hypothetical protein